MRKLLVFDGDVVLERAFDGDDVRAVEDELIRVVPEKYRLHAHHWLILHGRYTCIARRPLCEKCVIADLCKWPGKIVPVAVN